MKYQLVLQWPSSGSVKSQDALVETEDLLIENLSEQSEVDGHDSGSSEHNIFILTNDAQASFEEVKAILGNRDIWTNIRAGYREANGNTYTVLWPKHLNDFGVV